MELLLSLGRYCDLLIAAFGVRNVRAAQLMAAERRSGGTAWVAGNFPRRVPLPPPPLRRCAPPLRRCAPPLCRIAPPLRPSALPPL